MILSDKLITSFVNATEGDKIVELSKGEKLVLNILVDKCIVEVYANETQALVRTNAFSSESSGKKIFLFSEGGSARFKSGRVWDMMPSNSY